MCDNVAKNWVGRRALQNCLRLYFFFSFITDVLYRRRSAACQTLE